MTSLSPLVKILARIYALFTNLIALPSIVLDRSRALTLGIFVIQRFMTDYCLRSSSEHRIRLLLSFYLESCLNAVSSNEYTVG